MIPLAYKLGAAAALLMVVALGSYFYGRHKVTVEWEKDKTAWQVTYDAQVKETAKVQTAWNQSKEREHEWEAKAVAAGTDAAAVARRLRQYQGACRSAVPAVAADPGSIGSPGAEPADIGGIEERHFANCAADASDYDAFHAWYNGLRRAQ
jgi:hypothetical protein